MTLTRCLYTSVTMSELPAPLLEHASLRAISQPVHVASVRKARSAQRDVFFVAFAPLPPPKDAESTWNTGRRSTYIELITEAWSFPTVSLMPYEFLWKTDM
ncbi:hypothetical protein NDU88_007330 [Pleurodeles waltl]|uniref:Uncharacterized protein n=1 Tax=Pleurodeles waltl TaxID=8319 RepID=A0AAV7PPX0_PLEWA|nr:hypothetical protein NDU88_007330 [Pleurodeles waltl]